MARAFTLCGLVLTVSVASASAQTAARLVGDTIGGRLEIHTDKQTVVDHASFMFGDHNAPAITVEFVAQYLGYPTTQHSTPEVVDMIITVNDPVPETSLTVNGTNVPQTVRPRTARAIVSSMAFDDFLALANAEAVVERAFDTELVFGAGQLKMLRSIAQRWSGASPR